MPLADARAMYPSLVVDHTNEPADRHMAEAICDWLTRFTPLVGLSEGNGMMLDITGCAHLFGGEEAMRKDIVRRLGLQGFTARTAVAGTVGAAWALARFSATRVIGEKDLRENVLPLPLAALRLDVDKLDALARVGLKKIADIEGRPRAPLAARFGAILLRRLDQILGTVDEPITPRLPVAPYIAERNFAEPVTHEAYVLQIVEHLAAELSRRMEERGEGARALTVTLFRVDGAVRRLSVATSRPLRDPRALHRLFQERFATLTDELDPGFGFDVVRLAVTTAEATNVAQTDIVKAATGSDDIAHLIDRLGVRFPNRVKRLGFAESHIPEYVVVSTRDDPSAVALAKADTMPQQDTVCARPLRLFERPEEVDVVAEVPDGPPARFRWRRVMHEVATTEGPERIAMEWWRDETGKPLTRDYFRVEDKDGRRFWLYREGLYARETVRPRWFVHGLFA
jgi:protein ImuB